MAEYLIIHIPADIDPLERGDRFEDPLMKALRAAGRLGKVVGGGTAFETEPEFRITGCDIEVEVKDLDKALPVIRDSLAAAKAPPKTTVTHPETESVLLRFTKSGVKESPLSKKPVKKRFVDQCLWNPGEVLAYRIARDRYVLLHVYGFGGLGPVFWVPEWCGTEIPDPAAIRDLIRKKPEYYRLGSAYQAWQTREGERDDRRLVRTGVEVAVPKNGLRGWFPGLVEVRPWPLFERTLKQFFGLVSVDTPTRLNHELGLEKHVAHLAVWHPQKSVDPHDAKRLFYGHASGFRRAHPDKAKQPVTEALTAFVSDLKSRFSSNDVWQGDFSAREGFVIMPIKRRKSPAVIKAARNLARRHGLAFYDPEAERLTSLRR